MLKLLCLYLFIFVELATSQNQYLLSTCPFASPQSYGSGYGNQPTILQTSPYNNLHKAQNPAANYQNIKPLITDQLQEIYLNRLLSNSAIQAFIDPSTKIYNQNGVEISDQIRPKGIPNVVNNYFIVPTDYIKKNNTKQRNIQRNYKMANVEITPQNKNPTQRKRNFNISKDDDYQTSRPQNIKTRNERRNNDKYKKASKNGEHTEISTKEPKKTGNNVNEKAKIVLNDQQVVDRKDRKVVQNEAGEYNEQQIQNLPLKENKLKNKVCSSKDLFDISEECFELDNRNIRNPVDSTQNRGAQKKSSKTQDNFMKQWMSYLNTFAPNQNFDLLDFSNTNIPYNFENIYQLPVSSTSGSEPNSQNRLTKNRKRKQRKNKQKPEETSKICVNNKIRTTTIELVPKFIEIEDVTQKEIITKPIPEAVIHSSEATHDPPDKSTEDSSQIMYDIIDYYPNFTEDAIHTTDEDELYLFHNRHFYDSNDDKELNRERRKYERKHDDLNLKGTENRRANAIPLSEKDLKERNKPVFEDMKFQTPPGLTEPGFETKRVNFKEHTHTHYLDGDDELKNQKSDVETVYAHSKVIKYGQEGKVESKPKVIKDDNHLHNKERKHHATDGDTTVVFAQSWL